jgi:hypothetical protein
VGRQHAGGRPGVAMQVQAKAIVHHRSWFWRGGPGPVSDP